MEMWEASPYRPGAYPARPGSPGHARYVRRMMREAAATRPARDSMPRAGAGAMSSLKAEGPVTYYQVVVKTDVNWLPYGAYTADHTIMYREACMAREAGHKLVAVLFAPDRDTLSTMFIRLEEGSLIPDFLFRDPEPGGPPPPPPPSGPTEAVFWERLHRRMDALELGPPGDRDAPYHGDVKARYRGPFGMDYLGRWLKLLARVHKGELGGPEDGLTGGKEAAG